MLMRLLRSMARSRSRKAQFNERIPTEHIGKVGGLRLEIPCGDEIVVKTLSAKSSHIVFSMRTSDPVEAVMRKAQAGAYLDAVFTALSQSAPVALTHRQCVALAGELYRAWAVDPNTVGSNISVEVWRNADGKIERRRTTEPPSPELLKAGLEAAARNLRADHERLGDEALERDLGPLADKMLLEKGIASLTVETRRILLRECFRGLLEGLDAQASKAGGDYRPDPMAERFPAWDAPVRSAETSKPKGTPLSTLLERWAAEAQPAPSTLQTYTRAVRMLTDLMGHEDTARITKADVLGFKDARIASGLDAKTVNDGDLAGLRSVFTWAVNNDLMTFNPATGVKAAVKTKVKEREDYLSKAETSLILSAALNAKQGREHQERWAGRRWAPWLMAYTGARVGSVLALRKQDVLQEDGIWCLHFRAEFEKTKKARKVPLHAHLVEMGFPDYAQSAPSEQLFLWRTRTGAASLSVAKQMLQRFTREALGVEAGSGIKPNHAWRHTFKTIGREAGIDGETLDAIEGHAPKSVGGRYGGFTPKAMARALSLFPRFKLS